ncbi:MAG TPA: hypothetical protein VKB78_08610 [Pirellulales bacterium]|nr:hypothetical protein [Pirellulales bacterium]
MPRIVSPLGPQISREKPRLAGATTHGAAKSTLECLILSSNGNRREFLSRAAAGSGWSTLVCADSEAARRLANRIAVKLAIIELEGTPAVDIAGRHQFSAELAKAGGPLLLLCGAERDRRQEVWARQLGVWLYLPGLLESDVEGLGSLCGEARFIVERNSFIATVP